MESEYRTNYYKVERSIKRLKSLGKDTSYFENRLREINQATKKIEKSSIDYNSMIIDLRELSKTLSNYETFVKANAFSERLTDACKFEVDENKYNDLSEELFGVLIEFNNLDDYSKLYSSVLDFIMYGFLKFGDFSLFDKLKGYDDYFYKLDKAVLDRIERIDLSKNVDIKIIKDKIESKGLNSNYADKEMIASLAVLGKEKVFKDALKNLNNGIKESVNKLDDITKERDRLNSDISSLKEDIEISKVELVKNGAVSLLSLSLVIGMVYSVYKIDKLIIDETVEYKAEKSIYSSLDDSYKKEEGYYGKSELTIYLDDYQIKDDNERVIVRYDLSSLPEMDLKDYTKLNLEAEGIYGNIISNGRRAENLDVYKVVNKLVVDYSKKDINLGVFLSVFIDILVLIAELPLYIGGYEGVLIEILGDALDIEVFNTIDTLVNIKDEIIDILKSKENIKDKKIRIKDLNKKINDEILTNEEKIKKADYLSELLKNSEYYKNEVNTLSKSLNKIKEYK